MKMMIALIVIVALVGKTMAGTVPSTVETLIDHLDESETLNAEQLLAKFDEIDLDLFERDVAVSEYVAGILYKTADKEQTNLLKDLTVAKLIEQNTVQLADCNHESFKQRIKLIDSIEQSNQREVMAKVVFGLNVYALRCLHLATYYCLRNVKLITKQEVVDKKFMAELMNLKNQLTRIFYSADVSNPWWSINLHQFHEDHHPRPYHSDEANCDQSHLNLFKSVYPIGSYEDLGNAGDGTTSAPIESD